MSDRQARIKTSSLGFCAGKGKQREKWVDFIDYVLNLAHMHKNPFPTYCIQNANSRFCSYFFIVFIEVCQCDYKLNEINFNACVHCATANKQTHHTSGNYFLLRI